MIAILEKRLRSAGYFCRRNLNLGPTKASLYSCKDAWWFALPFDVYYYDFEIEDRAPIEVDDLVGFEAIDRARTHSDRFRGDYP